MSFDGAHFPAPVTNTMVSRRGHLFLQSKGYLQEVAVPARVDLLLSAWRDFDREGFVLMWRATKANRWKTMELLCRLHDVSLTVSQDDAQRAQEAKNRLGSDPMRAYVNSPAFLESNEWRVARMKVLVEHGARCMCCGATARDGVVINVDHIKPRHSHPELGLDVDNLQVLCNACNEGKGGWDSTDWRELNATNKA